MNEQNLATILQHLTPEELLCQLTEECAESLAEEMADVALCMGLVADTCDVDLVALEVLRDGKVSRWAKRLEAAK